MRIPMHGIVMKTGTSLGAAPFSFRTCRLRGPTQACRETGRLGRIDIRGLPVPQLRGRGLDSVKIWSNPNQS